MLIVGKYDEAAEGRARMLAYSSFAFVRRHWRMKRTIKTKCAEFLREIMESRGKKRAGNPKDSSGDTSKKAMSPMIARYGKGGRLAKPNET